MARSPERPPSVPVAVVQAGVPHGAREGGWLPDYVYTGGKFEAGLAFFADTHGRITRFSREPADLAAARRLAGQAALPGLVNAHSHSFHRVLRGRTTPVGPTKAAAEDWRETLVAVRQHVLAKLTAEDVFDAARMTFLEMLHAGVTCVGEFHYLHHQPDGTPWPEPDQLAQEVVRAAHDVGLRIALFKVAQIRAGFGAAIGSAPARSRCAGVEQYLREADVLRVALEKQYPADEVWLGLAPESLATVPLEAFKTIANHARNHRLRLHTHLAGTPDEAAACLAEHGRPPVALLAEHGVIDKRFTAIDAIHVSADEVKLLGDSRAAVCACPHSALGAGLGTTPADLLLVAGAGVALGSDSNTPIDLLAEARLLEHRLHGENRSLGTANSDAATVLFHAATVTGARCLGATGGALEVGRPADFVTVNLFDTSVAGADATSLLAQVVWALERRGIRDVWVGARQRISVGRHINHGSIVGRFVELQKRLWS